MDPFSFWQVFGKELKNGTEIDMETLLIQVEELAVDVSKNIILPYFGCAHETKKKDGSLLTEIDVQAHTELIRKLTQIVDFPVLSEELTVSEQQAILNMECQSYWCIDPIDGTSNFVAGIPYWCVSIALVVEGQVKLGVVYDANRNECFSATISSATFLNRQPLQLNKPKTTITELKDCMAMIDFKRLQSIIAQKIVTNPPYRSQRSFGASALDLCWIAAERCQVYLHGHQKLWDHAAGLLILHQSEGRAETFQGDTVFKNNLEPKSVMAASNELLMSKWKAYYQEIEY